jgi:hypothetical protein
MLGQMSDIPIVPGDQIIDTKHIPSALDQVVTQMRTQKPCTSGYDDAQALLLKDGLPWEFEIGPSE